MAGWSMVRRGRWLSYVGWVGMSLVLFGGLVACGPQDNSQDGNSQESGSLTVELSGLQGADGTELSATLSEADVSGLASARTWDFLTTTVPGSPYDYTDTLGEVPPGAYVLGVVAGTDVTSDVAAVKGQGCEMDVTIGPGEAVVLRINGLNQFGDKGYGPCNVIAEG